MAQRIGIVVPSNREQHLLRFLKEWDKEFSSYTSNLVLYLIEDNNSKTFKLPKDINYTIKHYCYKDIVKDLGTSNTIIPRHTSAIRSYGYYKAYMDDCDKIITLDDDCYPDVNYPNLISNHILGAPVKNWQPFFDVGKALYGDEEIGMRGFPFNYRATKQPVLSVGAWSHNPDLDAVTQLSRGDPHLNPELVYEAVPKGLGVTMCGMNVCFDKEVIPISYFTLQGRDWGIDRWDDIWAGLFMKKILDHLGKVMVINSYSTVHHDRASNPYKSLYPEGLGYGANEVLWERLQEIPLTSDNYVDCYIELAEKLPLDILHDEEYTKQLKEAMKQWALLFK